MFTGGGADGEGGGGGGCVDYGARGWWWGVSGLVWLCWVGWWMDGWIGSDREGSVCVSRYVSWYVSHDINLSIYLTYYVE